MLRYECHIVSSPTEGCKWPEPFGILTVTPVGFVEYLTNSVTQFLELKYTYVAC